MIRAGILFLRGALNVLLSAVFVISTIPRLIFGLVRRKPERITQVKNVGTQDFSLPDALKDRHDDAK